MRLRIALVGVGVAIFAALPVLWPTSLDVNPNEPVSEYRTQSGPHRVAFRLLRQTTAGDNGLVQIRVLVNGRAVKTLPASFSHDPLIRRPAGRYRWLWLDGDLWPDVQLEPNGFGGASAFYIGSRDGGFYAVGLRPPESSLRP